MDQKQQNIHKAYVKLARNPAWECVVDAKVFDSSQTSIVRVFAHPSGQASIYAMSSTDGKTRKEALAAVFDVAEAIPLVAAEAGCVAEATVAALVKYAALG
jgi:hypothetical protein